MFKTTRPWRRRRQNRFGLQETDRGHRMRREGEQEEQDEAQQLEEAPTRSDCTTCVQPPATQTPSVFLGMVPMGCLGSSESAKRAWKRRLANTTPRKPPLPPNQIKRTTLSIVSRRQEMSKLLPSSLGGAIFAHTDGHGKQQKGRVHESLQG